MKADEIKRMDIKEFRELGFLQEANRQFFHPLGLALETVVDEETGEERLGGVWDYRDDPEGIFFFGGHLLKNGDEMRCKAYLVTKFKDSKIAARVRCRGIRIAVDNTIVDRTTSGTTIQTLRWAPSPED